MKGGGGRGEESERRISICVEKDKAYPKFPPGF